MPRTLTVLMVRSFSAGRSDSVTPLKTFLDSVAAVADFLHSFLNRWGKRFATLKEKTRIAKAMFSPIGCCNSELGHKPYRLHVRMMVSCRRASFISHCPAATEGPSQGDSLRTRHPQQLLQ